MTLHAGRALGRAWHHLWARPAATLGAAGWLCAAAAVVNVFDLILQPLNPLDLGRLAIYFAFAVPFTLIVLLPLSAGLDLFALRAIRGGTPRARDVLDGYTLWRRAVPAYLTLGLALTAGYLLFVLPGIILTLSFMLVPLYVVDQEMSVRQAFGASMVATRGHLGTLFVFLVLGILIALAGTALLIMGLVPAVAWLYLTRAELYRQARGETQVTTAVADPGPGAAALRPARPLRRPDP